ncbi:MAG: mechanosensitive ion channel family protein [Mastigocoleus sp. MO_167.B18]|nr:mechanosensitive ion channel family protein [Mastigocoleus sp. MO_167.B18]
MLNESLFIWGLFLILGFPIFTIVLGEGIEKLKHRGNPFTKVLLNIQYWLLPPLAILLVMRQILGVANTAKSLQIVETLFLIALIYTLLSLLNTLFTARRQQKTWQIYLPNILFQVIRSAVVLGITAYILGVIWKIDLGQIASAAGVGSLVVALALQDTLSNLVSGFLLILEAPFKIGDWIKVGQTEGEVIEINWRAVRLKTRERDVIVIPNGILGKDTIQNYTIIDPLHVVRVRLQFSYFDPPNRVIRMLRQTALATKGVASEPLPIIDTQQYVNTAIDYEVKLYIKDYGGLEEIKAEFLTLVYYAAKRYKFTLPYGNKVEYKLGEMPNLQGITTEEITTSLKALPYFTFLDTKTIEYLAQSATYEHFGIGERIVQAGELHRKVYIILEGSVSISVKDNSNREQEVVFLSTGDLFGETALLHTEVSQVSVTVIDDLKAIAIEPDSVIHIVQEYPKFAMEINSFIQTRKQAIHNAKGVESKLSENGKLHPLLYWDGRVS